jgi:GNAT superfamily N-acetyltransferase
MKSSLIVTTIILCIYFIYNKKNKHIFWNTQSVSRNGRVSQNIVSNNDLPLNMTWFNISLDELIEFIKIHYSENEKYTNQRLQWSLRNYNNLYNIGLKYNDTIIGTIIGIPMTIFIFNSIKQTIYVDYLCIHKDYRNKRIAPLLITEIIKQTIKQYDLRIFKIDNTPLPFDYIGNYNYYIYDTQKRTSANNKYNNGIKQLTDNKYFYKHYLQYFKHSNHQLYQIMSYHEFNNTFNEFVKTFHCSNNFISIINTKHKYNNEFINACEIYYIFSDQQLSNGDLLFQYVIQYCKQNNIKYIILLDIMQNQYYINKYNMTKSMTTYYQIHNYKSQQINKQQIGLNIP